MAAAVLTKEQRQHLLSRIAQRNTELRSKNPRKGTPPTAVARAVALVQAWEADQHELWNKRQKALSDAQQKALTSVEFPASREAALAAVVAYETKSI
jgi:hypothetical protein